MPALNRLLCRLGLVLGIVLGAPSRATEDTAAFRQRLLHDLQAGIERNHAALASGQQPLTVAHVWALSGMVNVHRQTKDDRLLGWTKDGILALVKLARQADGKPQPLFESFRHLTPFCEAYIYLKPRGMFTPAEIADIEALITASVATHYDYSDFGTHNRALIDAAGFYYSAAAVPDSPEAPRWRAYGASLAADSWNAWSIEDASIYQPFWLNYTLVLADLLGRTPEHMKAVTTRFYFDVPKFLLMPNGLLPDWGDGDWTHMWAWNTANLIRAGSYYHDGEYLEAARRMYDAHLAYYQGIQEDNLYPLGLALRWLDPAVPFQPLVQEHSAEVIDDLVSKKITFRSPAGDYGMLNYRDQGPYARWQREYQYATIYAPEERPHHGHSDENAIDLLLSDGTVLLADGGYRARVEDGWRADVFHNRIVARTGFPPESDIFDYLRADTTYHPVTTEKIHFGTFGSLDYSRTRLVDTERGYTGDRIILFAPESGLYLVVDSIRIDVSGQKVFCNTWHPDKVLKQGDNYVVSWPDRIPIRQEYWPNPHHKDLLIQFLDNRDKITLTKVIGRRYNLSTVFYQYLKGYFYEGQRLTFITVLRPHAPGGFTPAMLDDVKVLPSEHDDQRTLGLTFTLGGDPVTVGLKLDQTIGLTNRRGGPRFDFRTGRVEYGKLATDADFAYVRRKADGSRELGFMYGCEVQFDGRTLFDMPLGNHPGMFGETVYPGAKEFKVDQIKDKMPRWHAVVR
ncbi:MAG: hypothetical protein JSR48_06345 [Verrucomicrobia bacterium]|nr:hypothetical protein [Verrucomicrobiota bacterium]